MTLGTNFLSYNFYAQHEDDDDAQLPYFAEKIIVNSADKPDTLQISNVVKICNLIIQRFW